MDQVVEVTWHPSFEGVHHEVYSFLYHLHLCDYVRRSRICAGWLAGILSFLSTRGIAAFWPLLVPSWSSSKVLSDAFFWHNCSFRSWFCLVRHSIVVVKVWTCLSRAVGRGLSPWTLLVVTIERVSTMQLFVREAMVWLKRVSQRRRQLMIRHGKTG